MTKEDTFALAEHIGALTSRIEKEALWNNALKYLKNGSLCIEVGSWTGGSAVILGEVARQQHARLLCIDAFSTDMHGIGNGIVPSALSSFLHHTEGLPIDVLAGDSTVVLRYLEAKIADMIFIDGDHHLPRVQTDIEGYYEVLKTGGCYMLHDYHNPCDVKEVADRAFDPRSFIHVDSSIYWEKQ